MFLEKLPGNDFATCTVLCQSSYSRIAACVPILLAELLFLLRMPAVLSM
jgi:hypothetical protein